MSGSSGSRRIGGSAKIRLTGKCLIKLIILYHSYSFCMSVLIYDFFTSFIILLEIRLNNAENCELLIP